MEMDINGTTEIAMTWLTTEGLALAKNLIVFCLVIIGGIIAGRVASSAIGVGLDKSRLEPSPLFKQFATNVARKAIFLLAFIIGLGNLGIDTGALVAGLGVSGLVLGFALKDTLSNFSAGGLILLYRPFDIGHFVEIGGTTGTVKDLTLVSTILHTPDNKVITMPNSAVWGNSIINFSASETRRLDLVVGVAYDADIDQTMGILMEILQGHEKVLEDPAPVVLLRELGDSSVDFNVRGWVETPDYWPTHAEILRRVKYRLDEAGIGIPFPQREVWMHQMAVEPATSKERAVEVV